MTSSARARRTAESKGAQTKATPCFPGPVRVSRNGRYFVDTAGNPFFWLGDTAWPLFGKYSRRDAERYLENRAAKGFTVIQGVVAWGGGTGMEDKLPGPNYAGARPWLGGPQAPNEAYFKHVDYLVDFAARQGLVLAMLPTWGHAVNDSKVLHMGNARNWGRWLAARYRRAPNIVWVNGGDRIPTGFENVWRELARGLIEGDGGAHLITYHPCGWRSSGQFFHGEKWLDFNMIETWTEWAKVYPAVLTDALRTPVKPVVLGEGAYENGPEYPQGPITPLLARRQAWWSFMAGGFITYGQDQMWRMGPDWTSTFDTPGAGHMGVFKKIVTSRPWWNAVPDQGLFADGVSCGRTLNAAVRAADGSYAMVYLSSQCSVCLHLDKIEPRNVRVCWVDPRTGEERDAGFRPSGNRVEGKNWPQARSEWFTVPGHWEDAVLVLDGVP